MRTLIVLIVLVVALFFQLVQWLSPSRGNSNSERALQEIRVPVETDDTELYQRLVD